MLLMPERHQHARSSEDEKSASKKITGKELGSDEELRVQINTLIEMLDNKGIINKKEYQRTVSMRLHETSKALAFEEIGDEL
jgi:hypothetical protein